MYLQIRADILCHKVERLLGDYYAEKLTKIFSLSYHVHHTRYRETQAHFHIHFCGILSISNLTIKLNHMIYQMIT